MENETKFVKLPEELWGKELVLSSANSECIVIFELKQWRAYEEFLRTLPITSKGAREFRRLIVGRAFDMDTNEDGEIIIPDCMWMINFGEKEKVRVCRMEDFRKEFEDRWIFAEDYASHVIVAAE